VGDFGWPSGAGINNNGRGRLEKAGCQRSANCCKADPMPISQELCQSVCVRNPSRLGKKGNACPPPAPQCTCDIRGARWLQSTSADLAHVSSLGDGRWAGFAPGEPGGRSLFQFNWVVLCLGVMGFCCTILSGRIETPNLFGNQVSNHVILMAVSMDSAVGGTSCSGSCSMDRVALSL